ncbi:helix-turn-helix domain-containing protein [Sinosporangium siamense]|uniref:helix-turn-helix domain-containing protein n=1 Tax=Sinosporangium siamense TaxID=1367973 RepID=UPI0019512D52|nr:helix-turn-helix transcriptional regulator [Sinosporangium siamense]
MSRYNSSNICGPCARFPAFAGKPDFIAPHVWQNEGVLTALRARDFGAVSKLLRTLCSLRQNNLAEITGLSQSYISLLESGRRRLSTIDKIMDFLNALGAPEDIVQSMFHDLVAARRAPHDRLPNHRSEYNADTDVNHLGSLGCPLPSGSLQAGIGELIDLGSSSTLCVAIDDSRIGEMVMLTMQTSEGKDVQVTLPRRRLVHMVAGGALASMVSAHGSSEEPGLVAKALNQPRHVDEQVVDYFRRLLNEHHTADKTFGPHSILRTVHAQIEVLDELRRGAGTRSTGPLLKILSQYAEMAGWLHQDLGQMGAAMEWTNRAIQWAYVADDSLMLAYLLVRQANIAYTAKDHATVIQLARAARRRSHGLEPKLEALAAQQEASGLVMLGEHDECFTLLEQAAETLRDHPRVSQPDAPIYLSQLPEN